MTTSQEFVDYILDLLHPIRGIQTSRMFGGVVLKAEGDQLGVLFDDTFYLKVSNLKLQKQYKESGSKQFSYIRKDKTNPVIIKNWWSVPEEALDDPEEFMKLVEGVLDQDV